MAGSPIRPICRPICTPVIRGINTLVGTSASLPAGLVANGALNAFATFTRASSATYFDSAGVLQTVGNNVARTDYNPITLALRGLLLEETRTNLCLWNRDLTNVAWVATNVTAVKDQTGIDGAANSASKITASAANGTILQTITSASSVRITTAYVKRLTGSGTVEITQDNGTTWTPITVTASWTRVQIPSATVTNPQVGFRVVTSGDAIAVDYFQIESATIPTSAIATTTVSVSRSGDIASNTTLSAIGFNAAEGTIYAEIESMGAANFNNDYICTFSNNTIANQISTYLGGVNKLQLTVYEASVLQANFATANAFGAGTYKIATAYKANDFAGCLSGGTVNTDVSGTVPTVSRLYIGVNATGGAEQLNGWIKNLSLYSTKKTSAELQTLTT